MNTHNKLRAKIEIVATLSLGMQHFWYFAISSQGQTHLSLMQSVECVWFVCELLSVRCLLYLPEIWFLSVFNRNTKNWHIVYNWLPYSKPIERDAFCPDVHVGDFQRFKKRKQSWLTSRMESQYPRYVRTWEYIQINIMNGRNRPFPVCLTFFPETLFGRNAVINAKLIT